MLVSGSMKALDWSRSPAAEEVQVKLQPHARREQELVLSLPEARLAELLAGLQALLGSGAEHTEFRLALPQGVTIYWKRGNSETRLMVARPDSSSWVATILIAEEKSQELIMLLKALPERGEVAFAQLTGIWKLSNLELRLLWLASATVRL